MKQDLERLQYILNRLKAETVDEPIRSCSACDVAYSNIGNYVLEAISIVDRLTQGTSISTEPVHVELLN